MRGFVSYSDLKKTRKITKFANLKSHVKANFFSWKKSSHFLFRFGFYVENWTSILNFIRFRPLESRKPDFMKHPICNKQNSKYLEF